MTVAEENTITVDLPTEVADALLEARGWTVEPCSGGGCSYVLPGGTPRSLGGRFGRDFLWHRSEALREALVAEVNAS